MILERGIIHAYDSTAHTAMVQLFGSMSRIIYNVPVAHHIGPVLLASEIACLVGFVGEGSQAVIIATFDGAPDPWITSALIKDGEIASADIADGTILTADIADSQVTTAKIADGTIATADIGASQVTPAKLSFSPCTPEGAFHGDLSSQTLTQTYTTFQSLSQQITVSGGKTIRYLCIATAEVNCTAYTNYNNRLLRIYRDSTGQGTVVGDQSRGVNHRHTVTNSFIGTLTATATISARIAKALSRNTETCERGTMSLLWWENT